MSLATSSPSSTFHSALNKTDRKKVLEIFKNSFLKNSILKFRSTARTRKYEFFSKIQLMEDFWNKPRNKPILKD